MAPHTGCTRVGKGSSSRCVARASAGFPGNAPGLIVHRYTTRKRIKIAGPTHFSNVLKFMRYDLPVLDGFRVQFFLETGRKHRKFAPLDQECKSTVRVARKASRFYLLVEEINSACGLERA